MTMAFWRPSEPATPRSFSLATTWQNLVNLLQAHADSGWHRVSLLGASVFLFNFRYVTCFQSMSKLVTILARCDTCKPCLNFGKVNVTSTCIRTISNHPTLHILASFEWHTQPWDWHRKTRCLPLVVAMLNSRCKSGWLTGVVVLKFLVINWLMVNSGSLLPFVYGYLS